MTTRVILVYPSLSGSEDVLKISANATMDYRDPNMPPNRDEPCITLEFSSCGCPQATAHLTKEDMQNLMLRMSELDVNFAQAELNKLIGRKP